MKFNEYSIPDNYSIVKPILEHSISYYSGYDNSIKNPNYLGVLKDNVIILSTFFDRKREFETLIQQIHELIYIQGF